MKVLWFTNTPCLAEDYFNNKTMNGGFLKSLEKVMQEEVDLSIAFYYNKELSSFKYGKTNYFPIYKESNGLSAKIKTRIFGKIEPEEDTNRFIQIINEVKPDVIHVHGTEGPFGLFQQSSTVPTVVSIQGNISVYELKYFSGIPLSDAVKYTNIKERLFFTGVAQNFTRFKKQAIREKKIFKLSKNIIGRTYWDRRVAKVLAPNAHYFHNDEVLKEVFYQGSWQNEITDTLQLFTTTGPNIYKGIETLIHCAHLLDLSNIRYKWKVAGIKPDDAILRVATRSLHVPLSPNIEFLGKADDQKLKVSILACHIYLAISHIENSPNSLCEALILGAPCIATHAGGTLNFIKDRITGILIQDGDPFSMAGAIMETKENYNLAKDMGVNARKEALARHDKNKIVSDLLNIYYSISGNKISNLN